MTALWSTHCPTTVKMPSPFSGVSMTQRFLSVALVALSLAILLTPVGLMGSIPTSARVSPGMGSLKVTLPPAVDRSTGLTASPVPSSPAIVEARGQSSVLPASGSAVATMSPLSTTVSAPVDEKGTLVGTITTQVVPLVVTYDPASRTTWVAGTLTGGSTSTAIMIYIYGGPETTLIAKFSAGNVPAGGSVGLTFNPVNSEMYLTSQNTSQVLAFSGIKTVATITLTAQPTAITACAGDIIVAEPTANDLIVLSSSTNAVLSTIVVGTHPDALACDSNDGYVDVAEFGTSDAVAINPGTGATIWTTNVGGGGDGIAYDPSNGLIYEAKAGDRVGADNISVLTGATGAVVGTLSGPSYPSGCAVDAATGNIYITDVQGFDVWVVSGVSNAFLGTIASNGNYPNALAYNPDNFQMVVADQQSARLTLIQTVLEFGTASTDLRGLPSVNPVSQTIATPAGPYHAVYDGDTGYYYVTDYGAGGGNQLSVVSPLAGKVVANITLPSAPAGIAYDPFNGLLYVADHGSGAGASVSVIAPMDRKVVALIPVGSGPISLVFDLHSQEVYVANQNSDNISVIDTVTNQVTSTINLLASPAGLAIDQYNDTLFVTLPLFDRVDVYNTMTETWIASVNVGKDPTGIVYLPSREMLLVTNQQSANVTVINGINDAVVRWIPTGSGPLAAAYDPATNYVYVANSGSNNLTVISSANLTTVGTIPVGLAPAGVAASTPDGTLLVTVSGSNQVELLPSLSNSTTPSAATMDVGQSMVIDASLLGEGAGIVRTGLAVNPSTGMICRVAPIYYSFLGAACTPSQPGTYTVTLQVDDALGNSVWSSLVITGYADPVLAPIAPVNVSLDIGQKASFLTSATGGDGHFVMFSWQPSPGLTCAASNTSTVTCTPATNGSFNLTATVTDGEGFVSAPSPAATVWGYLDPALAPLAVRVNGTLATTADVGQMLNVSVVITQNGSGGIASVNWTGLPSGCTSTGVFVTCPLTAPGSFPMSAAVTDSNHVTYRTSPTTLTVGADPAASVMVEASGNSSPAFPNYFDVGQSVAFRLAVSGGSLPISGIGWTGLPGTGCTGTTTSAPVCVLTPTDVGNYTVRASVTDSNGWSATTGPVSLGVRLAPTVSAPQSSVATMDVGQNVSFTTLAAGGYLAPNTTYTYHWTVPALLWCSGLGNSTITCLAMAAGTGTVSVAASDSTHSSSNTSTSASLTVSSDPAIVALISTKAAPEVGDAFQVMAQVSGGLAPYVYNWTNVAPGCLSSGSSVRCNVSVPGPESLSVTVSDANGVQTPASVYHVTVAPSLERPVVLANTTTLVRGSNVTLYGSISGGIAPYSYDWAGLPAGCAGSTGPIVSCKMPSAGTYSVNLTVQDMDNHSATSAPVVLTVNLPPPAPPTSNTSSTPASNSLDFWASGFLVGLAIFLSVLNVVLIVLRWRQSRKSSPPK